MTSRGADLRATAPAVLAAESLRAIRDLAARPDVTVDEIRETAELAVTRLDFVTDSRAKNGKRYRWLAKVTSFAFPRTFSTGPLADAPESSRDHHHVCFTIQVTRGGGQATVDRDIEVQVPADKAIQLGQQMVRIAQSFGPSVLPAATRRRVVPPSERRRMT